MSIAISAVSSNSASAQFDPAPAPKQPAKPSEADQIKLLASQGRSAHDIATQVGLPETVVAQELGTTTSTTPSATSQASALLALGSRLSVHA